MEQAGGAEPPGAGDPVNEHVRVVPAPMLRPYVAWYSGYRQRGLPPAVHRGLPSPALTLIFTLDEPLVLLDGPAAARPAASSAPRAYDALVAGLHTTATLITHEGAQSGLQLALRPLGARALLGLPAGELAACDVPAEAVLGAAGRRLTERLRAAAGWPERFALLDTELAALVGAERRISRDVPPELRRAWNLLRNECGAVPVSALAAEVGWSARHLGSHFHAEIGLSPKAAARVIRFDRARRMLASRWTEGRRPRLAELAAECGYFDQAHLAREFRELAGCSPSAWLAAEFRNVQATDFGFDEALDGPGPTGAG
ncbi:DNA-binding domain-containing protein, AraC-type [Frankia sp. EI5c]|nr:DNA-binding domain-containing protein, AraC-type [Frankia sp. EI5c]